VLKQFWLALYLALWEELVKVKPSIFYFDDEAVLTDIFREMFSDEYEVWTATTVAKARRLLSECAPDIIISDWSMPEISGIDFLREAAELYPGSFRIMLTGFANAGDLIKEISTGLIQFFISKPWSEEQMRKALERATLSQSRKKD
jgi:two-component system, sensor histidine kinase and response regulator